MKLCPVCQRCYEDSDAVCSDDSTTLVSSRHGSRMIAEKYRLDRLLGRGGMGAVYEATHVDLDRPVAVKLLLPDFTADPEALERFRREARAAARLNHPNVADTYDYGSLPEGGAYIVMELIDGDTLREHMDAVGQLPFSEAIRIARQVTNGVEAAHRHSITHRDLKPSNIILTRDHDGQMLAKVVDFSVAKLKEGTTSGTALTATGSLIGTPRYMAPEQCADNKTDARSDIYSLGVILYEMIAGRAPFEGPTTTAIAIKHIQAPPPPVEEFRPDTPTALRGLIEQSLAKLPSERPQTAQEFAVRLDEAAHDLPQSAHTEQLSASANRSEQDSLERRAPETNRQKVDNDPSTRRAGEPTLEESISREVKDPSVQSYAAQSNSQEDELETKVSAKEADKGAGPQTDRSASQSEKPGAALTGAERKSENNFPLLSEHSKTPAVPLQESAATKTEGAAPSRSNLLPIIVAAALLLAVGLGIFMFVIRGSSGTGEAENRTAGAQKENAGPAANSEAAGRNNNQPALSDAAASPSPAPSAAAGAQDARTELQSLRDEWIDATKARNLTRLMSFYPPVVETFYLKRNVTSAAVRAEKQRMMEQASLIQLETSQPEINLSADGRFATMTFRKKWDFRGAQNSTGEVIQELRWEKTTGGWKIISERDIGVIR